MSFKNKNIVRGFPFFSHFACLPLIEQQYRQYLSHIQQVVQEELTQHGFNIEQTTRRHSHLLGHLTLFMVTLRGEETKTKLKHVLSEQTQQICARLKNLQIHPTKINYFTRTNKNQKCQQLTVIYLQIDQQSNQILVNLVDHLVRILLKHQIIVSEQLKPMRIIYNHKTGRFQPQTFHVSLFRCKNLMEREGVISAFGKINARCFGEQGKNQSMKFQCKLLDVSTMMAFDTTEFYQPFVRMALGKDQYDQVGEKQVKEEKIVKMEQNNLS